jgi:hypothetical protein
MSEQDLNRAIEEIRKDQPSDAVVQQAARRVFSNLFDSAYLPDRVGRITGCADFKALMRPYLERTLSPARISLLEDHVSECVECRRALRDARGEGLHTARQGAARPKPHERIRWFPIAAAAALAFWLAVGITGAYRGLLPGQHAIRATVVSVEGTLYRISNLGYSVVKAGEVIKNADELRTAKGSRAVVRLLNGARLEMAERSDMSVSGGWRGPSVNLERGHVIVQTADTDQRPFYLSTADLVIPVRDTAVFSVNRGMKGSRVAVAKGSTRVEEPQKVAELRAGQQVSTDGLVNVPIASEFAWSNNSDYYIGLLKELTSLQKELAAIPAPSLRYTTELAQYAPETTVIYAAIPNLSGTLTEAKKIFDQHLADSEVLRNWWAQQSAGRNGNFDSMLTHLNAISRYLGSEIVLAVPAKGLNQFGQPVVLAKVEQNGLADYLKSNLPANAEVQILTSATAPNATGQQMYVSLDNGFLAASPDLGEVKTAAALIAGRSGGAFTSRPFYNRIQQSYTTGTEYLLSVDMEQIVSKSVSNPKEVPPGFSNAEYLELARRDSNGKSETRAALSFNGSRSGIPSWLAAPGPMGSLDFVSPDATLAAAAVLKSPESILQELMSYMPDAHEQAGENDKVTSQLVADAAASLGGDVTFAIDGALLPVPAWKVAIEVYDAPRLEHAIAGFLDHFNQMTKTSGVKLETNQEQANGRTFYFIQKTPAPDVTIYYTFVDGYFVASSSKANLMQAIQDRQAGHTLASSNAFRDQLPQDGYTNFSAILYHHAGSALGAIANNTIVQPLKPAQQQAMAHLLANSAPGLICVYGERDRIVAVTRDSFLGFSLGTLVGIGHGAPILPVIASAATGINARSVDSRQVRR